MHLKQVFKIMLVFLDSQGMKAFFSWKPFSVTSFLIVRRVKISALFFANVIDGGANSGQFSRAAIETFPDTRIIAFEPLPEIADKFRKNLKNRLDRIRLVQAALGCKPGKVSFHRNSHSHSSSVLSLHENHRKAFPDAKDVSILKVPVTTLDIALKGEKLVGPTLLKLDLQGYELEALRGATRTLKRVDAVLLETSVKPMYKGEPTFKEIEIFLKAKGFYFSKNLDFLKDSKGNTLQMDSLFVRKKDDRKKSV